MLTPLKNWSSIRKNIKSWIKSEKVLDVILFGSSVRGKSQPNDVDLCFIIPDNMEIKALDLVDSLAKVLGKFTLRTQINFMTERSFFFGEDTLAKTLLQEGFSLSKNQLVASFYGLIPKSLFIYSLIGFTSSLRVRFHYLMRGRSGTEGMLSKLDGELIKDGVISVPTGKEDELKEILNSWKVNYKIQRIFLG